MSADYVLVFGPSRSPRYAEAATLASRLPGHQTMDGCHVVPITARLPDVLDELLLIVQGWRSTEFLVRGHPVTRQKLWAVLRVLRCGQAREVSDVGELYCWGLPGSEKGRVPCRLMERDLPWTDLPEYRDRETFDGLLRAHERENFADICPWYESMTVAAAWNRRTWDLERLLEGVDLDL